MELLRNPDELARLIDLNAPAGFMGDTTAGQWLAIPRHFALSDGDDLGLFEAGNEWPGPLCAHVMFRSRGKAALDKARTMLDHAFTFGATKIIGEVPLRSRKVRLFVGALGFRAVREDVGPGGPVTIMELSPPPIPVRWVISQSPSLPTKVAHDPNSNSSPASRRP